MREAVYQVDEEHHVTHSDPSHSLLAVKALNLCVNLYVFKLLVEMLSSVRIWSLAIGMLLLCQPPLLLFKKYKSITKQPKFILTESLHGSEKLSNLLQELVVFIIHKFLKVSGNLPPV